MSGLRAGRRGLRDRSLVPESRRTQRESDLAGSMPAGSSVQARSAVLLDRTTVDRLEQSLPLRPGRYPAQARRAPARLRVRSLLAAARNPLQRGNRPSARRYAAAVEISRAPGGGRHVHVTGARQARHWPDPQEQGHRSSAEARTVTRFGKKAQVVTLTNLGNSQITHFGKSSQVNALLKGLDMSCYSRPAVRRLSGEPMRVHQSEPS